MPTGGTCRENCNFVTLGEPCTVCKYKCLFWN